MCTNPRQEFNENQRAVFCVFSGIGVKQLRGYLNQQKATEGRQPREPRDLGDNGEQGQIWDDGDGGIGVLDDETSDYEH
jgi:F-box and leucine-rich repeat protein GRR1